MEIWWQLGEACADCFPMGAVVFGTWYLGKIIRQHYSKGFVICAALIYAGALGNLIDSCFYGLIFDKGMLFDAMSNEYISYNGLAHFSSNGYAGFLHGNVVDMLYFPVIRVIFPGGFQYGEERILNFSGQSSILLMPL